MGRENNRLSKNGFLIFLTGVLCFLPACGSQKPQPPLQDVVVQLKWVHQAQFAGMYIAQELGYYQQAGLHITFVEGGPGIDTMEAVTSGKADFSLTTPVEVWSAFDAGADIRVIASILQQDPLVFVAMADSGITSPRDFIGKTITVQGNEDYSIQLKEILRLFKIDISQVTQAPHTYDFTGLVDGSVDVGAFSSNDGLIRLRNEGFRINLFWPTNYDLFFGSDCLATSTAMVSEHPQIIDSFLAATLRGWRYALAHPGEALDAIMKYTHENDRNFQQQMFIASIPLINTGKVELGQMDASIWQNTQALMLNQGIITTRVPLNQLLEPGFINRIYEMEQ